MPLAHRFVFILLLFLVACDSNEPDTSTFVGEFEIERDLFLAQFDSKTDVDDIHSIAAVATMLADSRLNGVRYHAVAGAYGTQGGLYIPANELFDAAFGRDWSDAHNDFDKAVGEVSGIVANTLQSGGKVWIAEAGQSDFTAAVLKNINDALPHLDTTNGVIVVQHSTWNEESTSPANLSYVKNNANYNKIPDGNAIGNGSPGLRVNKQFNWRNYIGRSALVDIWEMALEIADRYNGSPSRYNNQFIAAGGLDFSDVSEACWIFGFKEIPNVEAFFETFNSK